MSACGGTVSASAAILEGYADLSALCVYTLQLKAPDQDYWSQITRTKWVAERLGAKHGLAGFGLIYNPNTVSGADEVAAYPYLKKYPDLHCVKSGHFTVEAGQITLMEVAIFLITGSLF